MITFWTVIMQFPIGCQCFEQIHHLIPAMGRKIVVSGAEKTQHAYQVGQTNVTHLVTKDKKQGAEKGFKDRRFRTFVERFIRYFLTQFINLNINWDVLRIRSIL
eukprot:Lithocolla_globosa_v1_NODE_817_length_3237_cov_73.340981.p2 type:complete len:104 gc:universal NODE_817_length_3237_cov_73.340981:2166-2477(+)